MQLYGKDMKYYEQYLEQITFFFVEILDSNRDAFNFPSMQPTKFNANMHFSSSDIPLFVTEFLLVFFTSQSSIFIIDDLFQKNYVTILNKHI